MKPSSALRVIRLRGIAGLAAPVLALAIVAACGLHAHRAREAARSSEAGIRAVALRLPSPDVAFAGGARWLRAPTVEEPGAAQADGIAFPDPEPGGGALVPPRAAWAEEMEPR